MNTINGTLLRDMILSAANNLENNKQAVNDLNVFPVPDGDTGTNMSLSIGNAARTLRTMADGLPAGEVAKAAAMEILKGARGNSGVILSLLFRGFSKGIAGLDVVDGKQLAAGLAQGVQAAYKAVMKPTEGTILTVARVSADAGVAFAETVNDAKAVLEAIIVSARDTLNKTPEMLPVLKQANVVDAGGQGYICILEGMRKVLSGEGMVEAAAPAAETQEKADFAAMDSEEIEFGYCTEFFINKCDSAEKHRTKALREFLVQQGDSLVFVEEDDFIKVHIHTEHPGRVLEEALRYGFLTKMKIENMREQLGEKAAEQAEAPAAKAPVIAAPEKKYGFVAVSAGEGISGVFSDLGVDVVIKGGQTMNPSTESILEGVNATPAEVVFVLPNNKNIILAAEMTKSLTEKEVVVLPTKTVPQGVAAMLAFDEFADTAANAEGMMAAASAVKTAQLTYAVRDSEFDGHSIKEGEIMGLLEGKVTVIDRAMDNVLAGLSEKMGGDEAQFVTIYAGADVTPEQVEKAENIFRTACKNAEVTVVEGGQPVYYFIISVE